MPVTIRSSSKKAYSGPDPVLVKDQQLHLQSLLETYGMENFCAYMLWIRRKNPEPSEEEILPEGHWNRRLIPFKFNEIQHDIEQKKGKKNICLKYRQGGYTTYFINTRLLLPALLEPGTGSLLISQKNSYAAAHFRILKRAYRYFGAVDPYDNKANILTQQLHENLLHLQYSNRRELIFDQLDSSILCDSAEIEEVGQGLTLHHIVGTENARWPKNPEETLANVKEALVADGTLDLESTANSLGGYFYEECMRARDKQTKESEFTYFFHQWFWQNEYRTIPPMKESALSEEERDVKKKFRLDMEQMTWRRGKIIALRHNFKEKYPEDDITCFLVSGQNFFDVEVLAERLRELQYYKPLGVYSNGEYRVFHKRIRGRRYVIGSDVAQGILVTSDDTDFSAAVVLDEMTGEEVAAYRARLAPEDFANDLFDIATQYNDAMIGVERTGDGSSVLLTLDTQHLYPNIYKHREWWKREKKVIEIPGFPTNQKTRPIALNKLRQFVRTHPELVWDIEFVEEALRFIRNEKGKPAAAVGTHDDTVSARWVAHYVRLVNLGYLDPIGSPSEKYGQDAEDEAAA